MDNSNGPDDEITINPLPVPHIPIPRAVAVIAGRIPREWLQGNGRRLTWRGWLLAAIAAVVVIGALKLAGVIWTSAPPTWVTALGTGVTVTGPERVAPGHGSPGAAFTGSVAALSSGNPATFCDYIDYVSVGSASRCKAVFGKAPRNQLPYGASFKIGYVAISGTRALVGFTGKICSPGAMPECMANTSPAVGFSAGKTFAALWTQVASLDSVSATSLYRLQPCVEVGGKWYDSAPVDLLS
jgi:hypothetical protein